MAKAPVQHSDKFNQLLADGDYVVYPCSGTRIGVGRIKRQTPKKVRILPVGHVENPWGYGEPQQYPHECVKLEGPALTMYIIAKSS